MKTYVIIFFLLIKFFSLKGQSKDIIYALKNVPKHEIKSPDQLVGFINAHTSNDYVKAIGVYYWVATHIKYDVKKYLKDKPSNTIPSDVFRKGKAVCIGYATLYQYLCSKLNLNCQIIRGYGKGYGYKSTTPLIFADHAWNAVKIDSVWQPVDVTWGSGALKRKLLRVKFMRHYTEDYFMVNPKIFVLKHLPEVPMWQLLNYPLSTRTFASGDKNINAYVNSFHEKLFIYSDSINSFLLLDSLSRGIKYGDMAIEFNHLNTLPLAQGIFISLSKHIIVDSLLEKNASIATLDSMILEASKGIRLLKRSKSSRKSLRAVIKYYNTKGYKILAGLYFIKSKMIEKEIDFASVKDFNLLLIHSKPFTQSLENSLIAVRETHDPKYIDLIEMNLCDNYYYVLNLYKTLLFNENSNNQKWHIQKEIGYIISSTKKNVSPDNQCYKKIMALGANMN